MENATNREQMNDPLNFNYYKVLYSPEKMEELVFARPLSVFVNKFDCYR